MNEPMGTTEERLRAAAQRLLSGEVRPADGKLTKSSLYKEAGVSRASMNRATALLTEWDAAVTSRTGGVAAPPNNSSSDRAGETNLRSENVLLKRDLADALSVIALLHEDNRVLRERIQSSSTSRLVALRQPSAHPDAADLRS
jgi:hypothetical protein